MKRQVSFIAVAALSLLGATIGSLIYALWASSAAALSIWQVLGVALIAVPIALPTAIIAVIVALLAWYSPKPKIIWAVAALVGIGCMTAFPIYMTAFAPATNWGRGLLLPFATYTVGLALGAVALARSRQRGLPRA